tara:strand:- start:5218 stop:6441 length:1224 start_codon:yes stop_codon:yes gene_type:complete
VSKEILIVGAGHAAGQIVTTLKQQKFSGQIVLVGDEPYLPYQRPPLSKKFLAGEVPAERLHVKAESFYDDPQIDVRLSTRVTALDRAARVATTDSGGTIHYDTAILATGSRVRKLPGHENLPGGIHYLRTIDDVLAIQTDLAANARLVIIGAGYIGLEVAAVARSLGLDVTVVEMADRVMSRVVSPEISSFYQQEHERHGVQFNLSTGLQDFLLNEQGTRVTGVLTDNGETIPAELVIVGVGIVPNTELAQQAGLEVDNGVVVDEYCRSSDASIFAVGDCASHPSEIYGRQLRLESVHNALEQAKTAAANACGKSVTYSQVPWFWSDQYDLKLQIAGLSEGYDSVVLRGDPAERSFSCLYMRKGKLVAIDAINAPRDFLQAKPLIAAGTKVDAGSLADSSVPLKDFL